MGSRVFIAVNSWSVCVGDRVLCHNAVDSVPDDAGWGRVLWAVEATHKG